jgi:hypothetical protein
VESINYLILFNKRRTAMKRQFSRLLVLVTLISFFLYLGVTVKAQEASVEVAEAVICADVVDREPVDVGDEFETSVNRLFCFTKIIGVQEPIEITHVWYWGEIERARVSVPVGGSGWRTWSTKAIQAHETGEWHVDVLGPGGELLKTLNFTVKGVPREEIAQAPGTSALQVTQGVVCRDAVDREPVDVGVEFESTVGKLFCFTKIEGVEGPVEITHVWYFGDTERARTSLPVGSSGWRTWSTKNIMDHEIGEWHVDVLDPEGELLRTVKFTIIKERP